MGVRRARPIVGTGVETVWSIAVRRVTTPRVISIGEAVIVHRVTPDDLHSLVALDRGSGAVLWDYASVDRIHSLATFADRLLVTLAESGATVFDVEDGSLIDSPFEGERLVRPVGRVVVVPVHRGCDVEVFDRDFARLGQICWEGVSGRGLVARVRDGLQELSAATLEPISDVIPLPDDVAFHTATVAAEHGVVLGASTFMIVGGDGSNVLRDDSGGDGSISAAGPRSAVVVVHDFVSSIGLDLATGQRLWERPGQVQVFGTIDGVAYGTARADGRTELFSLDTGATRCVIDDEVVHGENGFYARDGVAYDFRCSEVWRLDVDADVQVNVVDDGVVLVERISDEETRISFLS